MRKKLMIGIVVLGLLVLYVCLVCLPYKAQGKASAETMEQFAPSEYYGEQPSGERAMILSDNEEALEERIRLISEAKSRLVLCTFEFRSDNSGKKVLAALYDAARRGVEVQILVDGGPYVTSMMGNAYFRAIGSLEHVTIKTYNPVQIWKPSKFMSRMHDKYLIADDTAYILGGRNTYDYFLGEETNYKNYDWDVLVYTGEVKERASLPQLEAYFSSIWKGEDCQEVMEKEPWLPSSKEKVRKCQEELEELYRQMRREHPAWFEREEIESRTVPVNRITLMSNPIVSKVKEPVLLYQMTELMIQAEGDVTFHTPYIMCNDYMLERLEQVCASGKKVRMMTNSVANNGNPFGGVDYQMRKPEVLATGVEILEYDQGVSYHGKCFTIGERLSAVGSFNWDMRSAYIDTELMLVIDSPEMNQQMRSCMETYEQDTLLVKDADTYWLKEGQIPQEISEKKRRRLTLLRPVDQIFRFLF